MSDESQKPIDEQLPDEVGARTGERLQQGLASSSDEATSERPGLQELSEAKNLGNSELSEAKNLGDSAEFAQAAGSEELPSQAGDSQGNELQREQGNGGQGNGGQGNSADPEQDELAEDELAEDELAEDELAEDDDAETSYEDVEPIEMISEDDDVSMDWYILKVQSNRERSIAASLQRKVAIEGLDRYFGEIVVPTEKVTEFKGGKKKIVERKLYPGYIVVQMHINDDTWFAVRETSGIGDFTGSGGKPTPMSAHEVARIVQAEEEETDETPKLDIKFNQDDKVKVKEGTFEGFEGDVSAIDQQSGKITVMINIFGRSTPVELEYWQVEGI